MKPLHFIIAAALVVILIGSVLYPVIQDSEMGGKSIDVLIIDGQSNAEYGGIEVCNPAVLNEEYTEAPAHNVYYYGTSTAPANQWDWSHKWGYAWSAFHIHNAYNYTTDQWIIGGYEPILGNTLAEKSGNDTLVINMGIGARSIADLLPNGADANYSWTLLDRALNEISQDYKNINIAGVVWIQGETDGAQGTTVEQYKTSFVELMNGFKKYGANEFYLVATRDEYGGNASIAQDQLAQEYSNVIMATEITETFTIENGMLDANPIHYSQKGRDAISFAIRDQIIVPPETHNNEYGGLLLIIPVLFFIALIAMGARMILNGRD